MSVAARTIHGIGICLIPRPENEHRPYILRHKPLASFSALLIAAKLVAITFAAIIPTDAQLSTITANRIVQLTNAERTKAGLSLLQINTELTAAAEEKGKHMLDEDYFAHISPSGVTPWFWIKKHGYSYQIAGENLAINFTEAEETVAAWIASPSHKDNMLQTDYSETGVAAVTGEFQGSISTIVVQMFGLPSGSEVPPRLTQDSNVLHAKEEQELLSSERKHSSPVPDIIPPAVPLLKLINGGSLIGSTLKIDITGEPGSRVLVFVNGESRHIVALASSQSVTAEIPLKDVQDGVLAINAYATDPSGNKSERSKEIAVKKDTQGPNLSSHSFAYVIAPQFDKPSVAILSRIHDAKTVVINQESKKFMIAESATVLPSTAPFSIQAADDVGNITQINDISVVPAFEMREQLISPSPYRIQQYSRQFIEITTVILAILLFLAIVIRIRIQHPTLITHSALVIALAGALLIA